MWQLWSDHHLEICWFCWLCDMCSICGCEELWQFWNVWNQFVCAPAVTGRRDAEEVNHMLVSFDSIRQLSLFTVSLAVSQARMWRACRKRRIFPHSPLHFPQKMCLNMFENVWICLNDSVRDLKNSESLSETSVRPNESLWTQDKSWRLDEGIRSWSLITSSRRWAIGELCVFGSPETWNIDWNMAVEHGCFRLFYWNLLKHVRCSRPIGSTTSPERTWRLMAHMAHGSSTWWTSLYITTMPQYVSYHGILFPFGHGHGGLLSCHRTSSAGPDHEINMKSTWNSCICTNFAQSLQLPNRVWLSDGQSLLWNKGLVRFSAAHLDRWVILDGTLMEEAGAEYCLWESWDVLRWKSSDANIDIY